MTKDQVDEVELSSKSLMEELVQCVADLVFDCRLITVLASDQLFLLGSCARLLRLEPGQERVSPDGASVAIRGDLLVRTHRVQYRMERGEFLTVPGDGSCHPRPLLLAQSPAAVLWIPLGALELFSERNTTFRRTLKESSLRSGLLAAGFLDPDVLARRALEAVSGPRVGGRRTEGCLSVRMTDISDRTRLSARKNSGACSSPRIRGELAKLGFGPHD